MSAVNRTGAALVKAGVITESTLDQALAVQKERGQRVGAVLVEMGAVTEDLLIETLAREAGCKTVRDVAGYSFPPELLRLVDGDFSTRHLVFPLKQKEGMLAVALTDPFDDETIGTLARTTGLRVVPFVARKGDILSAIAKNYPKEADSNGKPKILVVDDSQSIVKLITTALEKEGYQVAVGFDGLEGMKLAIAEIPDLIICDTVMPRMDGYGLLRALKANPVTAGIPMILLTAKAGTEDQQRALEAGFLDFISKPVQPVRVISRVKRAFDLIKK